MAYSNAREADEMRVRDFLVGVASSVFLLGCPTTVRQLDENEAAGLLASVRPHVTTGRQLAADFGTPHSTYEKGRISAFPVVVKDGKLAAAHEGPPRHYLMVVYGPDGTVVRRTLVDVRGQ
jgi:hypothetical protein